MDFLRCQLQHHEHWSFISGALGQAMTFSHLLLLLMLYTFFSTICPHLMSSVGFVLLYHRLVDINMS